MSRTWSGHFPMKARRGGLLLIATVTIGVIAGFFLYASRRPEPVLFYYGGGVEVPGGTALAIMNPFRDTVSERTAERLIADLRTGNCAAVIEELGNDPRICPTLEGTHRERLVWREDRGTGRMLVYELPEKRARLWIGFAREEGGFAVRSLSVIR